MALCNDILVVVLHSVELVVFLGFIDTARVVMGCGLSSDEDFGLTSLATLLAIVVIRVCPFQLVLRTLVQRTFIFQFALGQLRSSDLHIGVLGAISLRVSTKRLRDNRALFAASPDAHQLITMGTKYLLPELVLTVRAELLRGDLVCDCHSVLLIVLPPDRIFIQLARFSLGVHVTYLLHLKALFERF